ncbi:MAG TPA: hypothetical protein VFF69_05650, partial [Phycisphaerales bacterium]|nr:hypothetical protein [Phycisphaerales bacterium]
MDRKGLAILGASAAVAGAAGLAEAGVVIYQNDFESGALGSEWSGPRRLDGNRHFTRFNGR